MARPLSHPHSIVPRLASWPMQGSRAGARGTGMRTLRPCSHARPLGNPQSHPPCKPSNSHPCLQLVLNLSAALRSLERWSVGLGFEPQLDALRGLVGLPPQAHCHTLFLDYGTLVQPWVCEQTLTGESGNTAPWQSVVRSGPSLYSCYQSRRSTLPAPPRSRKHHPSVS